VKKVYNYIEVYEEASHEKKLGNKTNGFNASQMPVKIKIKSIEDLISLCSKELDYSKKNIQLIKTELSTMDYTQKQLINCCTSATLEEIKRLSGDLNKMEQSNDSDSNVVKQQISKIFQEKIKLQLQVIHLNSKVESVESSVGYEKS